MVSMMKFFMLILIDLELLFFYIDFYKTGSGLPTSCPSFACTQDGWLFYTGNIGSSRSSNTISMVLA